MTSGNHRPPGTSVVVPVRNEAATLQAALRLPVRYVPGCAALTPRGRFLAAVDGSAPTLDPPVLARRDLEIN